ncbi:MAG: type I pullulanase [Halanaerobiales bacterium]
MDKFDYIKYIKKLDIEMAEGHALECKKGYFADDLGIFYTKEKTIFRVWSPTATAIEVLIYKSEADKMPEFKVNMQESDNGIWFAEIPGDLQGMYHIYNIFIEDIFRKAVDPYTKGLGTNSELGLIVNLEMTNPPGWEYDRGPDLKCPQDAVIYEVHLRDFSSSENSGIINRNKYLAFTENGTVNNNGLRTGIDHLKELGITHIHLQPVFDFATVDDLSDNQYNWGYDPYFYNVPEGSYSTNPSDDTRIREFKQMVKAIHDNGLGIIMDVVYNHTYHTENSPFNKIVPGYYYRRDYCGNYFNGSGTGNETASEKPMVRKFIVDSVKYWAEEYHIDGFRFDLMALHDKVTMNKVEKVLHNINPSILIYGEPWTGGFSPLSPDQQMLKGAQKGMNIAVFNDHFRNAIKGDNDGHSVGFVSGAHHQDENIKRGVVGAIPYDHNIVDFAEEPGETVNYVSSHDNLTLWDKLHKSNMNDSEDVRIKIDRLAQGIVFTSQGIPFIHGGEEILRTKYGNHNSYNAGDIINQIKWERKNIYYSTFCYYKGLIDIRRNHPAFRLRNAQQIREFLSFLDTPYNTVGFSLAEHANNDNWKTIVVFYNPNRESITFNLPFSGQWNVVVDEQRAGNDVLYTVLSNNVKVPPITMMVMYMQ